MTDPLRSPVISSGFGISTVLRESVLMARHRRRFGRLFYLTAGLAALVLAGLPFWEPGMQWFRAWQLARRLHDPAESVRREAAEGLVQLGPGATPWVIRASRDPDARVRILSCSILARTTTDGHEGPAEALLAALHDTDPSVRAAAAGQLERVVIGPGAPTEGGRKGRALRALAA